MKGNTTKQSAIKQIKLKLSKNTFLAIYGR